MVYDFNAFSKLKTIVKHSLQINFIFPGAPGWCVHAADALSIVGGGAERRWGTPRAAPLSPAHPGPRPEVAMTATDASLARTDRPGKQRILRGTGRVSGCPQSLLWELLCLQLHPHLKL